MCSHRISSDFTKHHLFWLNQNHQEWGPENCLLPSLPVHSDGHKRLRTSAFRRLVTWRLRNWEKEFKGPERWWCSNFTLASTSLAPKSYSPSGAPHRLTLTIASPWHLADCRGCRHLLKADWRYINPGSPDFPCCASCARKSALWSSQDWGD